MNLLFVNSLLSSFLLRISLKIQNKSLQVRILNLRQLILRQDCKFLEAEEGVFIREIDTRFYFPLNLRNIRTFSKGIRYLVEKTSRAYHLDLIDFQENDLVIDCGANVGVLYYYLRIKHGPSIRYLAFEPGNFEYKFLKINAVENCELRQAALSNVNESLKLFYAPDWADSSIIEPKTYNEIYNIQGIRLDTELNEDIKLLKVDAEGAEPEVILGAIELLPKIKFISIDLGFERGKNEKSTLIEVFDILTKNNFQPITINKRLVVLFKNKKFN